MRRSVGFHQSIWSLVLALIFTNPYSWGVGRTVNFIGRLIFSPTRNFVFCQFTCPFSPGLGLAASQIRNQEGFMITLKCVTGGLADWMR